MTAGQVTRYPYIVMGPDSHFATPYSISERRQEFWPLDPDRVLRAKIPVVFPAGKRERIVFAELTEEECLLLAEKALEAARALRKAAKA